MRLAALVTLALALLAAAAPPLRAQDPAAGQGAATCTLRTSIKGGALLFRTPDAPELFGQRSGAESFWRIRLEPEAAIGEHVVLAAAYEQRLHVASRPGLVNTAAVLPVAGRAAYRVRQLDWSLSESAGASWRHEIDRASVRVDAGAATITVGRQAVGWGRGVLFGAVDLFAPFSPLEADREWRRGIDAIHADVKLTDRSSFDLVAAGGDSWDRSALAARVRAYAGRADVELVGGRRARDLFAGAATSAAIGDVEVHGELAVFRAPGPLPRSGSRVAWKGLAGGSYRFPVGAGLLVYAEYHYSEFGARRPEEILPLLADGAFIERYLRGDTQILSRHAIALLASYDASTELAASGRWVLNPLDGSGILAPALTATLSDQTSIFASVYIPYGAPPRGQLLRSEYGAASLAAFLQLRIYL